MTIEPYPEDRPRTATVRSRLMLEVASELAGAEAWGPKQALVRLRAQGSDEWAVSLFASDAVGAVADVASGDVDVAIVNPATAVGPAVRGLAPFSEPIPLAAIATIPSHDQLGLAVAGFTHIEALDDLRGDHPPLRISLRGGRPDHSVHMILRHVFDAVGAALDDLMAQGDTLHMDDEIPHREPRRGRVLSGEREMVCDEGVYNWVEMATEAGFRFLSIPEKALEALEAMGYRRSVIERRRYPSLSADVTTIDFSGFMVYTRADAADDMVEAFCRAMLARRDRIPWQGGPTLPLERMVVDSEDAPIPIPLHAAAGRVWREAGLL